MKSNSFLKSHQPLMDGDSRLRVARQIHAILNDWYKGKGFNSLTALDYGCSSGVITNYLANHCREITGIDIDEIAIKKAAAKYKRKNLTFILNHEIKIPFKERLFDLVICNQIYSYLDDPDLMMKEIHRVLKDAGICLFTGDNLLRPIEPLYNLPFIRLFPRKTTVLILRLLGYKNIYIGNYKNYWQLKNLFGNFNIYDYSFRVLKRPKDFKYKKLEKFSGLLSMIPDSILKLTEPLYPSFIFILEKKG